jgi:hypothetical protein
MDRSLLPIRVITRVDKQGFHVSPVKATKGYTIAIGAIARDGVKITCMDFWKEGQRNLREYLLMKLFD